MSQVSADLRDLYQEVILDHNKRPRNFHLLEGANRRADGHNPLCGDKVTVYLKVDAGIIQDVSFQGAGCAISTASASLMTEALKGKSIAEAQQLFEMFHKMLTDSNAPVDEGLGKLTVLSGVCEFPIRVKCATLAWHTLQAALQQAEAARQAVTTE